jgi:hypothetical protein
MKKTTLARIIVTALFTALMGGAYLIVARNSAGGPDSPTPSGFMH